MKDNLTERVRKFLKMVRDQFYTDNIDLDSISDSDMMEMLSCIMSRCSLSFTTFVVGEKDE